MTVRPFLDASFIMQLHMLCALPALLAAPVALWRRRRDRWHKRAGYARVTGIVGLSLTGLLIPSGQLALVGHLGPIHLFSAIALVGVFDGVRHARARRFVEHRLALEATCFGALGLAGLFSFVPGRRMNEIVLDAPSQMGWIVVGCGFVVLAALWWRQRRGPAARV